MQLQLATGRSILICTDLHIEIVFLEMRVSDFLQASGLDFSAFFFAPRNFSGKLPQHERTATRRT